MNTVGLITEYNPFHNGHLFHLEKSKEVTNSNFAVAVMSGNFVQRGQPAVLDKFYRCKVGLCMGLDMILELPVFFATGSAEFFSLGAVNILNSTGIINSICFGSESGNINELKKVSSFLIKKNNKYENLLKENIKLGFSFPVAREKTLAEFNLDHLVKNPNNILGIEYLKALEILNSNITPFTITREKATHNDKNIIDGYASASSIRNSLHENNFDFLKKSMPKDSYNILLSEQNKFNLNNLSSTLHYIFSSKVKSQLLEIMDLNEDLYNRINFMQKENFFIEDIIKNSLCKNYTETRIRRVILNILMNMTREDAFYLKKNGPPYIRVLGFKKNNEHLLSALCKKSSVPTIINFKQYKNLNSKGQYFFRKELLATQLFYLCSNNINNSMMNISNFENKIIIE